jgi:hypothetical protein
MQSLCIGEDCQLLEDIPAKTARTLPAPPVITILTKKPDLSLRLWLATRREFATFKHKIIRALGPLRWKPCVLVPLTTAAFGHTIT